MAIDFAYSFPMKREISKNLLTEQEYSCRNQSITRMPMNTDNGIERKPPYLPYTTFKNFLASLKAGAIPSRIDKSLLDRYSGSMRSWLISALKFFGFTDDYGKPLPALESFIESEEQDRKKIWREIFDKSYASLI